MFFEVDQALRDETAACSKAEFGYMVSCWPTVRCSDAKFWASRANPVSAA